MKVIDLTHEITEGMPVYPGTEPPGLEMANTYEKDGFKETRLSMYSHTGTHADPPSHLFLEGTSLDRFPAEQFIGRALVIDCTMCKEGEFITMEQLKPYEELCERAEFLLFYTGWDQYWGQERYFGNYPCIDYEVLDYILAGNYKGIGFDVIGLDPIAEEELPRHKKLLGNKEMINLENLTNLKQCPKGLFWFGCFPLKIKESDGAPVRALAWEE